MSVASLLAAAYLLLDLVLHLSAWLVTALSSVGTSLYRAAGDDNNLLAKVPKFRDDRIRGDMYIRSPSLASFLQASALLDGSVLLSPLFRYQRPSVEIQLQPPDMYQTKCHLVHHWYRDIWSNLSFFSY